MSRRYPYWTLLALAAVLAAPVGWAPAAVLGAGVAVALLRLARALHGSRWRSARAPEGAIMLGRDAHGRRVWLSERELSAHALILGASGAGKTTTLLRILSEQVRRGQALVAIDMKGSPAFTAVLAEAAARSRRPFRVWTPDGPERWNPLQHGNATELKDKLIATERFTEPHYQRAAERYVQTVLQALGQAHPDRPPTLEEVVRLMDPRWLPSAVRGLPRPFVERVLAYRSGLTHDQLSAIRGLQTRLAIMTESHTGRYLSPPAGGAAATAPIDLRQALAGREVVLFSLNSSTYGKLASQLGTLVVQDLVCAGGHRLGELAAGRPVPPATIAIDESAVLGENLVALFARCREARIGVVAATQEVADYDRIAFGLRDQVLGNTALKLAHRQDVPASAQIVAQMAGTEKTWEETERTGGSIFSGCRTGGGTRRLGEQFIVHPNEIKTLAPGQAVLISKLGGGRPRTIRVTPAERPRLGPAPARPDRRQARDGPALE